MMQFMLHKSYEGLFVMKNMQRQKGLQGEDACKHGFCTCCCRLLWLPLAEMPMAGTDFRTQERLAEGWLIVPSPGAGCTAEGLSALPKAGAAGAGPVSESRCGHQVPVRGSSLTSIMVLHSGDRFSGLLALQQPTKAVY